MWKWMADLPMAVLVVIFLVVALGVGTLVWYIGFERPIQDAKRDAIKHSHAYIEASRSRMLKYVQEYATAGTQILQYEAAQKAGQEDYSEIISGLRSQQKACMQQIKEDAERIPQDEVPESVRELLN